MGPYYRQGYSQCGEIQLLSRSIHRHNLPFDSATTGSFLSQQPDLSVCCVGYSYALCLFPSAWGWREDFVGHNDPSWLDCVHSHLHREYTSHLGGHAPFDQVLDCNHGFTGSISGGFMRCPLGLSQGSMHKNANRFWIRDLSHFCQASWSKGKKTPRFLAASCCLQTHHTRSWGANVVTWPWQPDWC